MCVCVNSSVYDDVLMGKADVCVSYPQYHLHHMSSRPKEDPRHQTSLPRNDH